MKKKTYLAGVVALAVAAWPLARTGASPRCYPTSRFVVLDGGLVRDTLTKLVWQRQASGASMTWPAAQTYCSSAGAGFRLPTVRELRSIVDLTKASPAPTIDQAAFPNTPPEWFWTSSPYAGSSSQVWRVHFGLVTSDHLNVDSSNWVRCVR